MVFYFSDSKPVLGRNGVDSKHANGSVANKDVKNADSAFNTKRDKFSDFNKAMTESKDEKKGGQDKGDKNGKVANENEEAGKDTVDVVDEKYAVEKRRLEEGITIYKLPKKPPKKPKSERNRVDATLNTRNKDSDDMELGAEASNIKDDKKDDEEEKEKVIEIYTCWPVLCAKK